MQPGPLEVTVDNVEDLQHIPANTATLILLELDGLQQLPASFASLKQLQLLYLHSCASLTNLPAQLPAVLQQLRKRVLKKAAETVPVVGHVAAAVHYAKGDKEKAKSAWHSSSKTACVVGTALPLAIICPPAAAPAAYGAALAYDASHSAVSGHKKGLVAAYGRILKGESNPGEVHDVLFGLGSMGAGVALAETGAVTTSAAATGADAAAAAAAVETTRAAVGSAAADAAAGAAAEQQSLLQEAVAATSQEAAGAADTAGP
ncbi:hypothetical protein OEZ85_000773 [Tetradesmus obliquus]|uniref:Uncharacterized protein n=1 Tax=Tetradesmus obliquus TaxID=3088 RepID=A0ABY8UJN2_TETOB|nr:hypothetical protein OEZ85_000773 [Tetradesmus obliquus]